MLIGELSMKKTILAFLIFGSFSAYAISDNKLIDISKDVAIQKLQHEFESMGQNMDSVNIEVCAIDNRTTNFLAKYLMFCATTADQSIKMQVITQKPLGGECFAGNPTLMND